MASVAILGAGPGGCFAALAAARRGQRVTLLERNAKPLKKLLASGNGRGNLLNTGAPRYYGDAAFARAVLARVPAARLWDAWQALGVPLRQEDEGRVYPAALMAAAAADALLLALEAAGVATRPNARVEGVNPLPGGGYRVSWREDERACAETFDAVIVAAGGQAAPSLGAEGDGCALLRSLGHEITPTRPALCALQTEKKPIAGLSGLRARAALTLLAADGRTLHAAAGEALFADDGVSGIAAMQLGRFVEPGCTLRLDLRPALCRADAPESDILFDLIALRDSRAGFAAERLLTGWLPGRLGARLVKLAGLAADAPIGAIPDAALRRVAALLCGWRLAVSGARGWEHAQVTAGGAVAAQFDASTMQSKLHAGLYAVGEALDVDGDCGGFNLMFACASGLLAGEAVGR